VANESFYRGVQMVLGDPDPGFSRTVSAAFFARGLRDLAVCGDADQLRKAVSHAADVVLCDVDIPRTNFCEISQDIRHGRLGANPFTVLIAMTRPATEAEVTRVLKSGIDDLIFKPMEPELVVSRIGAFAKRRNPFVVTPAYIGPTRRDTRRNDGSDDETIEVPNTLRAKVAQASLAADVQALVETGLSSLNEKKAQSSLRVICRLARRVAEQHTDPLLAAESRRVLGTLAMKADELELEHRNSSSTRHVSAIAERIARLARRGESTPIRPSTVEVNLLLQLSDAALAAFLSVGRNTGLVPEIVAVVEEYLARN
jgi:DNA-binding response OmpR family regulator